MYLPDLMIRNIQYWSDQIDIHHIHQWMSRYSSGSRYKNIKLNEIQHLEVLNLQCMRVTEIPAEIAQLRALKELSLQANRITEIPKEIGQLQDLK